MHLPFQYIIRLAAPAILTVVFASSCTDWLNITQKGQIEANDLYSDEIGYEESLAGVYQDMASTYLYGRNMVTIPDAMAQFWALPAGTEALSHFKKFDFEEANTEKTIADMWATSYKVIANVNLLLGYIANDANADKPNYRLIKGEALGIRVLVHMDLMRLLGPAKAQSDDKAIPYRTSFDNKKVAVMPVGEVLDHIEADLLEARSLLQNDPVKVVGRKKNGMDNYNSKIAENYRGCRMNYYAVTGLLARFYALKGDLSTAEQYAQEVVDAHNVFWLVSPNEVSGNPLFQQEILFSLYLGGNILSGISASFGLATTGKSETLTVNEGMLSNIFTAGEGMSDDYRRTYGWRKGQDGELTIKYYWEFGENATTVPIGQLLQPVVPIIRLSEMYLIIAEAHKNQNDGKSVEILNVLRKSRNLPALRLEHYEANDIEELVINEARREFIAEGQMFFLYKRLYHPILTETGELPVHTVKWAWPIPKVELQYNK